MNIYGRAFAAVGCLVMIVFISAAVGFMVNGAWWPLTAHLTVGATGLAVVNGVRLRRERRRMGALATIMAQHYRAGEQYINMDMLEPVIDDADLMMARASWRANRDLEWATRYANGDASDF